jgi:hypothetical protein
MSESWAELLDEMERRLWAAQAVIGGSGPAPAPVAIPEGIGPLPPEFRYRAERIRDATVSVEGQLMAAMGQLANQMRAPRDPRPAPAYFDGRA